MPTSLKTGQVVQQLFLEHLEGTESYSIGVSDTAGTGALDLQLVWNGVGAPVESPAECQDCIFAFDLNYTFDTVLIDPNGEGSDATLYALGTSLMARTHCSTVQKVNGVVLD